MPGPTPYTELNATLATLVTRIRGQLGANLVGAYLHGSFATGDFTGSSDVDLLVVIRQDLTQAEIQGFQALHKALFQELPKPWGQRIELSYAPASILCRWSLMLRDPPDSPRSKDWIDPATKSPPRAYPFWYLDNGADTLVRSEHDNSQIVRWVTREKGIVLAGPDPRTLIEPVTLGDLALQIRDMLTLLDKKWSTLEAIETRANQTFFVTLCVRALHTLETGTVTSKKAATAWGATNLNPQWQTLVEKAWAAWQGNRHGLTGPADREETEQTIGLIRYALDIASRRSADA